MAGSVLTFAISHLPNAQKNRLTLAILPSSIRCFIVTLPLQWLERQGLDPGTLGGWRGIHPHFN